jgi:hypothetical protein
MRRAVSGSGKPGRRVPDSVSKRIEQQNDEKMDQNARSGGTFVKIQRPFEADQAFQTFETEFDAPPRKRSRFRISCAVIGWEGVQRNEPAGGVNGSIENLIAFPSSIPSGLTPCFCGTLLG